MSTTSSIFTGSSQFASDFQSVVTRAVNIASLPITQLNADKTKLSGQATALQGLDARFQALRNAVDGIGQALSGASFEPEISDSAALSVTLGSGAMEGNYAVEVIDPGAYATSLTSTAWQAGTGAVRPYRLSIGGQTYPVSPPDNSAESVASAINSEYGDKVHAVVVNVGSAAAPDYRLSLQAVRLGDTKPDLLTGPQIPAALQQQMAKGSGALATSRTAQAWDANPALTYELSIGGGTYAITAADNSAASIASAVNDQYGDKVTAAAVNAGTIESPDYRITLTAVAPGDLKPDILATDGISDPLSLQGQQQAGSDIRSSSRTAVTWAADTGATLTYQLSLGGAKYALSPSDNTAAALVTEINARHGDKVQAAVVDLGTSSAHDYRITLTAIQPGDLAPDLLVSETSLQTQQATGAEARYVVNHSGKEISSDTRSVAIADGVTVTLLARSSGKPVDITVARPTSALSAALSAFADAYNSAVDSLDEHHGETAGALSGQTVLGQLSAVLSGLGTYSSPAGGISGLADLGLELDKTGHLSFASFKLVAADLVNPAGVTAFLGSSDGAGFLNWAAGAMDAAERSGTGLLAAAQSGVDAEITSVTRRIDDMQKRVDDMTGRMMSQMAAMDALVASMEQQYTYLNGLFESMQAANRQYS